MLQSSVEYILLIFVSFLLVNVKLQSATSRSFSVEIRHGYMLNSTSFQSVRVDGLMDCTWKCLELLFCFFFNYQTSGSGLCQVFKGFNQIGGNQLDGLLRPTLSTGFVFGQVSGPIHSCLDYLRLSREMQNGIYEIQDKETLQRYDVFCDFTSEPGSAWTLVFSKQRDEIKKKEPTYKLNKPLNELRPNFDAFRLSLAKMKSLREVSTHWRLTCDFQDGFDQSDYVRVKFSNMDMLEYKGNGVCKKMEYIKIRGQGCANCLAPWWQAYPDDNYGLHIDSDLWRTMCSFSISGSAVSEDNFGYYDVINTAHRCSRTASATTNSWIGGYI